MSVELVPLCTLRVQLAEPINVGAGPAGDRLIFEVVGAAVQSERGVNGKLVGNAAADWMVINGTIGTLDVRATLETDDGALIFTQYRGRTDLAAGGTIYVAPTFETGDERYSWLNSIQAVGKGVLDGDVLTYEWYEVR